jgi:hypothetical protein
MKILVVADIHSSFSGFEKILKEVDFDLLLIAGDISHFNTLDVLRADEIVSKYTAECYAVHGNCDPEPVLNLNLDSIRFIHAKSVRLEDFTLHGVGGSNLTPFNTPSEYPESKIEEFITSLRMDSSNSNVLLTHCPPRGILDKTFSGTNAGSDAILRHLEKFDFVFCGHIHEADGVQQYSKTILANPGPAAWNQYVIFDMQNFRVRCGKLR